MDIQQIIALLLVAVAGVYMARHLWRDWSGKEDHCAGCGQCGKPKASGIRPAPEAKPLVTIGIGTAPPRRRPSGTTGASGG